MTTEEAVDYVFRYSDSYSAMDTMLELAEAGTLGFRDWLKVLGECWSGCDNIGEYLPTLKSVLGRNGPLRDMMTDAENRGYDRMPNIVTCYRGCDATVLTGASWSLDWRVANSFPFLSRYRASSPVVVTARARKSSILALKLDRDEQEIVTFSARRVSVTPASEEAAKQFWDGAESCTTWE
jgi:hypothetical protein